MSQHFIFAGSFCPPTYGHLAVLNEAAKLFPFVSVVCSRDEGKSYWFSTKECVAMWQAYELPENVEVITYDEQVERAVKGEEITLIRGIRNGSDYATEQKVIELNSKLFGIKSYVYVLADNGLKDVSATVARQAAQKVDLKTLARCVAPAVVTRLLEVGRILKSVHMVVGQPGGGKSTFCRQLLKGNQDIFSWINTDEISCSLRSIAKAHFGEDLIKVAIGNSQELSDLIGDKWLELLGEKLRQVPPRQDVFVEVPYGLVADKRTQRFLGNKVIYVGCDRATQRARVIARGTPEHLPFFKVIPGLTETRQIAKREGLQLIEVDTSGSLDRLQGEIDKFLDKLWEDDR
jgi:pantetheine-phosphate adenylyltransferase